MFYLVGIFYVLLDECGIDAGYVVLSNIIINIIRIMLVTKGIGKVRRLYYSFINTLVLYFKIRWSITIAIVLAYFQTIQAFSYDIVTYIIGFYLLQLLISYLTPRGIAVNFNEESDNTEELYSFLEQNEEIKKLEKGEQEQQQQTLEHSPDKPLLRSLSELQIWQRTTFAFILGLICNSIKILHKIDIFWPLLLAYFILLVCYTIQKIFKTMQKYKYNLSDFQKMPS